MHCNICDGAHLTGACPELPAISEKIVVRIDGHPRAMSVEDAAAHAANGENITVRCPECSDPMDPRRLLERALEITKGVCVDCHMHDTRELARVNRERKVAIFGHGRC